MATRLTKAQEQEIVELYDDGGGCGENELSEAYGVSTTVILNVINRSRVSGPGSDRPTGGADSPPPAAG